MQIKLMMSALVAAVSLAAGADSVTRIEIEGLSQTR